jgi:hypothetical protein
MQLSLPLVARRHRGRRWGRQVVSLVAATLLSGLQLGQVPAEIAAPTVAHAADPAPAAPMATDWVPVNTSAVWMGPVMADPSHPGHVLAGGLGPGDCHASKVEVDNLFDSWDGGETWSRRWLGTACMTAIFAFTATPDGVLLALTSTGIYRSVNGGVDWDRPLRGPAYAVLVDPLDANTLYAADHGVQRSDDAGLTWTQLNVGSCDVRGVASSVAWAGTVVLEGGCGMQRSDDGGATWTPLPAAPAYGQGRLITTSTGTLYADATQSFRVTADQAGLWRSDDVGDSWTHLVGVSGRVEDLAADPRDPTEQSLLVAARIGDSSAQPLTYNYDLRATADGGATWSPLGWPVAPDGRPLAPQYGTSGHSLSVVGDTLYLGTTSGLWKRPLPARTAPQSSPPLTDPLALEVPGQWRPLASVGAPSPRTQAAVVWTGSTLLVWGGAA